MVEKIILENLTEEITIDYSDYLVSPDLEIPKPNPILSINQNGRVIDIFTEENISMIQGQAKSRKSTLIKAICQGIISGNNMLTSSYLRNDIAIVDTEQSTYDCWRASRVIKIISGKTVDYFSVAELNSSQKMQLVESYLKRNPNCGFLMLDNIVHFVNNFNDVNESAMITEWLVKIKKLYNVHICNVLHENAGDSGKARGHLGTNLKNLCETIIKVEKDRNNKSRSIVSVVDMRGEEFEPFCIERDMQGTPFLTEYESHDKVKW